MKRIFRTQASYSHTGSAYRMSSTSALSTRFQRQFVNDRIHHLLCAPIDLLSMATLAFLIGIALLLVPGSAQTLTTSDSSLNTGSAISTTYNAPGTSGTNAPVSLATITSQSLWLMYDNPWGISKGGG